MLQRLDFDQENKKPEQIRKEFDALIQTRLWRISDAVENRRDTAGVASNAPEWWAGEEEASSSFLAAMGVKL